MNTPVLQFLEFQQPAVKPGDYQVNAQQTVNIKGKKTFNARQLSLAILGERFTLAPDNIHGVFPPEGSMIRNDGTIPHLVLNKSTLPWERNAYGQQPWLMLLMIDEKQHELVKKHNIKLKQLVEESHDPAKPAFPKLYFKGGAPTGDSSFVELETGQQPQDQLTVIDIQRNLLESLLPTGEELGYLSHVRRRFDEGKEDKSTLERAVIIGNRLPETGNSYTVYLVSLENRYLNSGLFNFENARPEDQIRLVSLKNWSFSCFEHENSFEELARAISPGSVKWGSSGKAITSQTDTFLSNGRVPLPHQLRNADRAYSWYHGPLVPHLSSCSFQKDTDLPNFPDDLTQFNANTGMLEAGYASAFQLGRTLALQDGAFSTALQAWKEQFNQQVLAGLEAGNHQNIIVSSHSIALPPIPEECLKSFNEWNILKEVPFRYLIPSAIVLPKESIRMFHIDEQWVACLLYGAFSLGSRIRTTLFTIPDPSNSFNGTLKETKVHFKRNGQPALSAKASISEVRKNKEWLVVSANKLFVIHRRGKTLYVNDGKLEWQLFKPILSEQNRTGFILRSELVINYPDLQVDGYKEKIDHLGRIKKDQVPLNELRLEKIGDDVLLGIFEGEVKTLELYLKAEGLQFGLESEDHKLVKELRTEYLFNSLRNRLGDQVTMGLAQLSADIAQSKLDQCHNPQGKGSKFEFPVTLKHPGNRTIDIKSLVKTFGDLYLQVAQHMIGNVAYSIPPTVTQINAAQLGMNLLEGSEKVRFSIS